MSAPIDVFAEVINNLMQELQPLPRSTDTIFHLVANNINSPVLAEIQHLSLDRGGGGGRGEENGEDRLDNKKMTKLLPALLKMSSLISLALPPCYISPENCKVLFTHWPTLSKLQSLNWNSRNASPSVLQLLSQSTATNLVSLNLAGCMVTPSADGSWYDFDFRYSYVFDSDDDDVQKPTDDSVDSSGMISLLSSPVVNNLTHLDLGRITVATSKIIITLATSPHLSNLVSLDLSDNKIMPEEVAALATSTTLGNLTHLNLSQHHHLGDQLVTQLFSPPSLLVKKLQSLTMRCCGLTAPSVKCILQASPHLTELILAQNSLLFPDGAIFIATTMPKLTKLDLSDCEIGDDGYAALAASTTLSNLRELHLNWDRARAQSIITLINSPVVSNLTHLELSHTGSTPEVLNAIAQSPALSKLQHLAFGSNRVGDEAIIALSQATTLTNLISLDLSRNNIGPEGVKALCTSPFVSKLTSLNLSGNERMGNSVASVLAAPTSTLYSLLELNLKNTEMDNDGMLQLLKTPNLDQLNVLDIDRYKMNSSTKNLYNARF